MNIRRLAFAVVLISAVAPLSTKAFAQSTTSRLALVIGEAQYRDGPLATAANDGGLMADLLRQAGYDVTGAANLSQDQIRASFREFLEKVSAAGPQADVFVYLSGKGVQFAGENYLAPIEATVANSANVPAETVRLADFLGPLAGLPARARVVVLDIARPNNFGRTGQPLASGLAIVDAPDNSLVAFNAAPGTIAPDEQGPYGAYAQSLAEMLRQPGLPLNDAFSQVRLRVNEATRGGQTPWNVTKLSASMAMFAPAPGAPAVAPLPRARRPMREVSPQEAYGYAVEADTFAAYNDFLQAYPNDPLARRVRAMLAARREAITWRRTYVANTPEAYWTYLQRYPRGPHSADAERRLAFLSAPLAPPPRFRVYDDYDVPPPPPEEIVIVDRPRFYINEIVDVPPPVYAVDFLPPVPREYRNFPPPPPPPGLGFLPIPIPIPMPFSRPQGPQGIVVAPRFVQQPVAPSPGAPPRLPQGYTPNPPQQPGGPGGPGMTQPGMPGGILRPTGPHGTPPGGNPPPQVLPQPTGPGTPAVPGAPGRPGVMPPGTTPGGNPPPQVLPHPAGPGTPGVPGTPGHPGVTQPGTPPGGNPPPQVLPQPRGPGTSDAPGRPGAQPGGNPGGAPPTGKPPTGISRPTGPQGTPPVMQPGGNPSGAPPSPTPPKPQAPGGAAQPGGIPGGPPAHTLPRPPAPSGIGAPPHPSPGGPAPGGAPAPRPAPAPGAAPHAAPPAVMPRPMPVPHTDAPRPPPVAAPPHIQAPRPVAPPPAAMPHPVAPMPHPAAPPAVMPHPAAPPAAMPRPAPGGPPHAPPGAPHGPGGHGPGDSPGR